MRQKIQLNGLRVFAHHGVFEFEKQNGQEFVIDVAVWVDATEAVNSDDVSGTVHYGELADAIVANVASEPVDLIETLAWRLLRLTLAFGDAGAVNAPATDANAPATDANANRAHTDSSAAKVSPIIKAKVTVHKPNAPIDHKFDDVSVTVKGRRK
jgi:dihydroneopterin aldolase